MATRGQQQYRTATAREREEREREKIHCRQRYIQREMQCCIQMQSSAAHPSLSLQMATNPSSTAMAIHLLCFFCAKWWLLPLLLLDHTLSSSSPLPTSWGVWANLGKIPRRVEPCNYQISHAAAAGSYYLLLSFFTYIAPAIGVAVHLY